jgi:acyl-CoA dehydrogenase
MASTAILTPEHATDWISLIHEIGPRMAESEAVADQSDSFVAENFSELRARGLLQAGVPAELGGGGATVRDLGTILRTLAPYCPSTALALAMHYHQVAITAWRWRHQNAPVEPLLRRIAKEQIVLVSTGGNDWIESSGRAEKAEGGWRIFARKAFASASPAGTLLMTSAVAETPEGREVLHFGLPLNAPGDTIADNWQPLGMRGTGSNDVILDGAFVADAAIGAKRPAGKWSPLFHLISMIALPLVYTVYTGIADGARTAALAYIRAKATKPGDETIELTGEMENQWLTADLMMERMLTLASSDQPGPATTHRVMHARNQVARAAIGTVEQAVALVGGGAFMRRLPFERMWRDVQGARFHPLSEKRQVRHAGRHALGLPLDA